MWKKIRYFLSHCLVACQSHKCQQDHCRASNTAAVHWRQFIMEFRKCSSIQHFGYLHNVVLLAALCLGLYIRWARSQDLAVLLIAFIGLVILTVTAALVYYFSMQTIGISVARLWIGCLLGVISFPEADIYPNELLQSVHEVMNSLLVISLVLHLLWIIISRLMHLTKPQPKLINCMDCLEMVGIATSTLVVGKDFLAISLLVFALFLIITTIQTRAFLGMLNLVVLVIISTSVFFPKLLHVLVNPFALVLFFARMSLESFVDFYLSSLTSLERWYPLLQRSKFSQRLLILAVATFHLAFFIVHSKQIPNHKEWFVVVPLFFVFGFVWVCYHLVFLVTCWQLTAKMADCNATFNSLEEDTRNLNRIMAAKGIRHFSLISQRLALVTLLTTIILAGVGWTTKTALSVALWMNVLPTEICVISLLWELGSTLGGTCVGYGVVAPALYRKGNDKAVILPAGSIEAIGSHATDILKGLQSFFMYHLIDIFGCDFSSSGITADSLNCKLKAFFEQTTADGPRYDTYLLYYSGPVYENGDWALAGNDRLTFDTLIAWWQEVDCHSGARLILILDTEHSYQWLHAVRQLQSDIVGIQTCVLSSSADPESIGRLGDFTAEWIDFNSGNMGGVQFHSKERSLRAVYAVSKSWTDFTFHLPTEQDISQHWSANFPRITKPVIALTNFPQSGSLSCCECLLRCLKRKRMLWLPPLECDTGHGFRLVRS